MKKIAPFVLVLSLALSSCAREDIREELLSIRAQYLQAEEIKLSANIREELETRRYDFSAEYSGNADCGRVKITKPDEISGISVVFGAEGELSIEYEDISLAIPQLYDERLSPAAVVPFVLKAICSAYIDECHIERIDGKDYISAELDCGSAENEDTIICTVLLSRENGGLCRAECSVGGRTLVYIDF